MLAAAMAPITPGAVGHSNPLTRKPAPDTTWKPTSNTMPATRARIGTVTRIGGGKGRKGPAANPLTGCVACRSCVVPLTLHQLP